MQGCLVQPSHPPYNVDTLDNYGTMSQLGNYPYNPQSFFKFLPVTHELTCVLLSVFACVCVCVKCIKYSVTEQMPPSRHRTGPSPQALFWHPYIEHPPFLTCGNQESVLGLHNFVISIMLYKRNNTVCNLGVFYYFFQAWCP